MLSLGYNEKEIQQGVAEFKKSMARPRLRDSQLPVRSNTEALVTDPLTALASGGNSILKAANWFAEIVSPESWDKTRREWLTENQASIDAFGSDNLKARKQRQEDANKQGALKALDNAISDPVVLADMLIQSMVSIGVPVGTSAKAGQVVLDKALKAGLSREAAEQAAATAATRWALYSEGALAAGTVGATVKSALDETDLSDGEKLAWEATALPAGLITAVLGKFSPVEASLFTSKLASQGVPQKLIPAIVTNASKEAVEEYLQSANEALWSNVGSKQVFPNNPQAWDGVAADAALGGLLGFATGGALGAVSKRKILKPVQQAQVDEVLDRDVPGLTGGKARDPDTFDNEAADTDEVAQEQATRRKEIIDQLLIPQEPTEDGTGAATELEVLANEAVIPKAPDAEANPYGTEYAKMNAFQLENALQSIKDWNAGQKPGDKIDAAPILAAMQALKAKAGNTPESYDTLPTIPDEIKRGNPTTVLEGKKRSVVFANDVDKALFIVAEGKRLSPIDQDLVTWLSKDVFPSASEDDIRAMGGTVRLAVADLVLPGSAYTIVVPGLASKQGIADANAAFAAQAPVAPNPQVPPSQSTKRKVLRPVRSAAPTPPVSVNPAQVLVPQASTKPSKRKVLKAAPVVAPVPTVDPNPTGFTKPSSNQTVTITEADAQRLFDTLAGIPGAEIEAIAKHIYDAIDSGYGEPIVDREKYIKAKALARVAKQAYSLATQPSTEALDEVEALFTQSDTTPYTTQQVQDALEDQALSPNVVKALRDDNIQGALWGLYLSGSTPVVRATAKKLFNLGLDNIKVKLGRIKAKDDSSAAVAGRFDNARKLLELDPTLGLNEMTLLHEGVHAATLQTINRPITPEQRKAVAELTELFETSKAIIGDGPYAFTDLDEFVAEALSNPKFQALLYQLRPGQTKDSAWDRFVNAVIRLLGLGTMLDRVRQVAEALMVSPNDSVVDKRANKVAAPIKVKPSDENYTYVFGQNHPIQNFAKQLEKQLLAQGASIPDVANLRLQNVLKRSQAEAAIREWTTKHWDGIASGVRLMQTKHGKDLAEVEKFLEQLQALGRAPQKLREYDPTMKDYARERARLVKVEADADAYLLGARQTTPDYFADMISMAQDIRAATKATLASRLAAKNNMSPLRLRALDNAFPNRYMPNGFYIPLQLDEGDGTQLALMKRSLGKNFSADRPLERIYAQAAMTAYSNENNKQKQLVLIAAVQNDVQTFIRC
jgi:hypothetical protein